MALSKIDVANMLTGATPVANGGTGLSVGDGVYTLDRFETNKVMDAVATITQETLTSGNAYLNGFKNAFKVDVTTADTTLTGTQRLLIQHAIEGQNLQALKFGTANAEKLTLAFWVKATKTGTNIVRLYAPDDNRAVSASYTVSSSDTWEHKVLNFPADTTGVIDNDNGNGLSIAWCIGAGADFQSGTLATTWGTQTAANDFVGQVNNLDSTSNNFHLTGVQLEVGEFSSTTLPPFQHESFGDNLQRCLRYYYRANGRCGFGAGTGFVQDGAVKAYIYHTMPVAPRTEMSFSLSGTSSAIITIDGNASDDVQSISSIHADSFPFKDYEFNFVTNGSSVTDKAGMGIRINASNYIECDAEL
jgi:hypothetical protein